MNMYRESAPRTTGMGLKIVKFHQLLHLWWIIKLFGSLLNVDGARGESNAITLTKQPGLHTQMRHIILNLQTASERFNRDVILKCYQQVANSTGPCHEENLIVDDEEEMDDSGNPHGSKFEVQFDYVHNCISTKWLSPKMKSKRCRFPTKLTAAVFNKLSCYNGGYPRKRIARVTGFTELKVKYRAEETNQSTDNDDEEDTQTIRACPSFRNSRPWFDWAMVRWTTDNIPQDIEAQVMMMLDMTTVEFEDCPTPNTHNWMITNSAHDIIQSLQVAFIHSADGVRRDKSHAGRKSSVAFWLKMETSYQMVDLKCIDRPCFVIVDKMNDVHNGRFVAGEATDIISILPKCMWSTKFLDYDNIDLKETAL